MTLKTLRYSLVAAAVTAAVSVTAAFAADENFISDAAENIAINGYDPVAYHTAGTPTKGVADYKVEWDGAVWKFSSEENMNAFTADPVKFAPAFGGWCTVGASKGKKIATQPELFKVVDGTLYLNSSDGAHNLFLKDEAGTIDTAETNWVEIESVPAADL